MVSTPRQKLYEPGGLQHIYRQNTFSYVMRAFITCSKSTRLAALIGVIAPIVDAHVAIFHPAMFCLNVCTTFLIDGNLVDGITDVHHLQRALKVRLTTTQTRSSIPCFNFMPLTSGVGATWITEKKIPLNFLYITVGNGVYNGLSVSERDAFGLEIYANV